MKFKIIDPSKEYTEIIDRDCIENVIKFLEVTGRERWTIEPIQFDIYQELRIIGLTHNQCDQVIALIEANFTKK